MVGSTLYKPRVVMVTRDRIFIKSIKQHSMWKVSQTFWYLISRIHDSRLHNKYHIGALITRIGSLGKAHYNS